MKVNSTELQNNFGKYLMLAAQEDIIITRNGMEIAKLSAIRDAVSDCGAVPGTVMEKAKVYGCDGRKASYEEFLELTKDTEERYEYIDGEIYLLASPKTAHQIALTELFGVFYNWFQGKECTPLVAPYDITLKRNPENINVVQPDIMVICDLEEKLDENDYYQGVPALVVEILSEGTRRKDLIKKLDLYMSCGVREYWIANPINREVTVYLFADNNISSSITYRKSEIAQSYIFEGLSAELGRIFK
ncbi:prevent-host-death family protein [Desulfotomaculum arcticum]|uniref:Prevent-host-death family protein n=1 Tax=Desulfotruncus arcticus DSM 17038 TaxID=1121424 RepID=A0A1I2XNR0_9FIRM|nr:type II toxin-antitoxin system prevent-host-death family antitoxin [Desulfotruncus arcticus]SFH15025.1 prevent-host-death family protein [Desulfotomaculum arcticum] [Desulfotruncus arcticus DSM 17038]